MNGGDARTELERRTGLGLGLGPRGCRPRRAGKQVRLRDRLKRFNRPCLKLGRDHTGGVSMSEPRATNCPELPLDTIFPNQLAPRGDRHHKPILFEKWSAYYTRAAKNWLAVSCCRRLGATFVVNIKNWPFSLSDPAATRRSGVAL